MITTAGKNHIRDFLLNGSSSNFDGIAVGTDDTTAAITDTALGTRVYGETTTKSYPTTTRAMFDMNFAAGDYPATGSVTLKEVGLFTSADGTSGTMLCRQVITDTIKTTSIAYRVQYDINVVNV